MGGISMKNIVYLIYDYYTLESMSGDNSVVVSSQAEASVFKFGRHAEVSAIATAKGIGSNIALSYDSLGIFGGISIEGGIMKGRKHVNEQFYGMKDIKTADILFSGEKFNIPSGTLLPELYAKLEKLCTGSSVHEPTAEEQHKIKSTRRLVEEAEADAAQQVSFYIAAEGDESVEACSQSGSREERDVNISNHSSASRNRACSTSSVPSVILEDHVLGGPSLSATTMGLNSLAVMSESDIVIFEDKSDSDKNVDRSQVQKECETQAAAFLEATR
jgi:Las17-binding protein actin regulator